MSAVQPMRLAQIHRLAINPMSYSELSLTFSTVETLGATLADLQIPMIDTGLIWKRPMARRDVP